MCQNLFPVVDKQGGKGEPIASVRALYPIPGMKQWTNVRSINLEGNLRFSGLSSDYSWEIYWELLNRSVSIPNWTGQSYYWASESFVDVNPADYNGTCSWEWEIVGFNNNTFDAKIQVIDESGTNCGEVTLAASGTGPTGYELFRSRVAFTPTSSQIYGLRVEIVGATTVESYPVKLLISTARIVLTQGGATKTRIQIPMMSDTYSYVLQYSSTADAWPYDHPVGQTIAGEIAAYNDAWTGSDAWKTIWRFDEAELYTVSKVTFSAAACGNAPVTTTKTLYVTATVPIESFNLILYTSPTSSSTLACDNGTPVGWAGPTQVHVDGCTGATFTPISSTYMSWDEDTDPYPYDMDLTPDLSGLAAGTSYRVYIGGNINDAPWGHFAQWFSIAVPAGAYLADATLKCASTANNQNKWTLTYKITTLTSPPTLYLALWNKTTSALVPGSELSWTLTEGFARKDIDIDVSDFDSECEYELTAKLPGQYISFEVMDAQIWLNIDPISKLTVWYRVAQDYDDLWDNWSIPAAWNYTCIGARSKLYLPESTSKTYFEATGYGTGSIYLEDMGTDDSSGAGGSDVTGSTLTWAGGDRSRERSGELTLTDANRYTNRQPAGLSQDLIVSNGFIIIKVTE